MKFPAMNRTSSQVGVDLGFRLGVTAVTRIPPPPPSPTTSHTASPPSSPNSETMPKRASPDITTQLGRRQLRLYRPRRGQTDRWDPPRACAGAGNSPEVLTAAFERLNIHTAVRAVVAAAEEVVKPSSWACRSWTSSTTQGCVGLYSSVLIHAERAATRYTSPPGQVLEEIGKFVYVGGQEGMRAAKTVEVPFLQARGCGPGTNKGENE